MATGPKTGADGKAARLKEAERLVDAALAAAPDGDRVRVPVAPLDITEAEWMTGLRPAYIKGGWKAAEWTVPPGKEEPYLYFLAP